MGGLLPLEWATRWRHLGGDCCCSSRMTGLHGVTLRDKGVLGNMFGGHNMIKVGQ